MAAAKAEQQKLANEETQRKQAEEQARIRKKAVEDSMAIVTAAQQQAEKQLAEAAQRKKFIEDSIATLNAEKERLAQEAARRKATDNSLAKEIQATTAAPTSTRQQPVPVAEAEAGNVVIRESDTPTTDMKAMFFAKNSYDINTAASEQLKALLHQLQSDPTSHLNIYALASTGENNPRQTSLRRSDMVLRYFIQAGIPINRIRSFYYGNNISRNGCTNPNCPEELLQQNRCVVYDVVKK